MAFILAYCQDNKNVAQEIDNRLSLAGIDFKHIAGSQIDGENSLYHHIKGSSEPIMLLVSDNFLKSTECMYQALLMLQADEDTSRIQPIIIDGYTQNEDGEIKIVETSFERVSNVIKYMNYWQEQYLDLRKQKREVKDEELLQVIDEDLKIVRSISSEIGEFLRILRGLEYWTQGQFEDNHYNLFFETIEQPRLRQIYLDEIKKNPIASIPIETNLENEESEDNLIEEDFTSNSQTDENNGTPSTETEDLDGIGEELGMGIAAIPGLSLLASRANDTSISTNEPSANSLEIQNEKVEENGTEEDIENETVSGTNLEDIPTPNLDLQTEDNSNTTEEIHLSATDLPKEQTHILEPDQSLESIVSDLVEQPSPVQTNKDIIDDIFDDEDEEVRSILSAEEHKHPQDSFPTNFDNIAEEAILRGKKLIEEGEVYKGLDLIGTMVNRFPNNVDLRYTYAYHLFHEDSNVDEAVRQLEINQTINAKHSKTFILLGNIAEQNEDWLLAKHFYEKAVELDPENGDLMYIYSVLLQDRFDNHNISAIKFLEKTLDIIPHNLDARFRYASLVHQELDKPATALEEFERVVAIDTQNDLAYFRIAEIQEKLGNHEQAYHAYQNACQLNSRHQTYTNDKLFSVPVIPKKTTTTTSNGISEKPYKTIAVFPSPEATKKPRPLQKTVLITGATSGIGRATAEIFAQNGYRLIITGRRTTRLETIKTIFQKKYDVDINTLAFDVRDLEAVKAAVDGLGEEWQNVDILINNAGLAKGFGAIHEGKIEDWETMIDTNVKGLLYMTRCISPNMVKRRQGHIINICSIAGKEVYPNGNVYCATKHAVDALTKAMRIDLHQHNIRVGQISPGHVEETEFAFVRYEDKEKAKIYEEFQPLKASDVAEVVYFMATRPAHVNLQDTLLLSTQQANSTIIDKTGR